MFAVAERELNRLPCAHGHERLDGTGMNRDAVAGGAEGIEPVDRPGDINVNALSIEEQGIPGS